MALIKLPSHNYYGRPLTPFAQAVLRLVSRIPTGRITTYAAIAAAADRPRAVRSVGTIIGANPLIIKVPCHRVIRSDGQVGDYRGGQHRKQVLLRAEGVEIANNRIINFKALLFNF